MPRKPNKKKLNSDSSQLHTHNPDVSPALVTAGIASSSAVSEAGIASSLAISEAGISSSSSDTSVSTMDALTKMLEYMERKDEERRIEDQQRRKEEDERRKEEFKVLIEALTNQSAGDGGATGQTTSPQATLSQTPSGPPVASTPKVTVNLPPALAIDATFRQFSEWKQRWQDYSVMVELDTLSQTKQLIQLRGCLSVEMRRVLEHNLGVSPDSALPLDDVLAKIEDYIKSQQNEALRRLAFSKCKQAEGESFTDFFVRLQQLSEEVDLCKGANCVDAQIKHAILVGIRSEELMKKLISMPSTATLQEVKVACVSYEAATNTTNELKGPHSSICAVSNYKKFKKKAIAKPGNLNSTHFQQKNSSTEHRCRNCGQQHDKGSCKAASNKCKNCARTGHYPYTAVCPAVSKECRKCHKYGHFDTCCAQNKKKEIKPEKSEGNRKTSLYSVRTSPAVIRSVSSRPQGCPSPPISLHIEYANKSGFIEIIPDTGADTTVIGVQHLQALGLKVEDLLPPPDWQFFNADGSPMEGKVLGSMDALMTFGDVSYKGYIDVQSSLPTPLLCYEALQHLRLIPWDFPRQLSEKKMCKKPTTINHLPVSKVLHATKPQPPPATATPEEAKQYFLKEYSDVLMTKAQFFQGAQLKPMKGPPMRIHLQENAKPFAIYTPRQLNRAYEDIVKQELEAMVKQGVIEPVGDEPSPWCHPLVTVPKDKGGIRITTDLSNLNFQVQRPAHPSKSPFNAIRSIDPTSRYFSTMDALCGYWQIPLAEEDRPLTTFITPFGRYRYCRSPMGFSASGDEYCRRGDLALQGLQKCVKVVDDILAYDSDYYSHLCRVNDILSRCRTHGITLNAGKFNLAKPTVSFCGYRLSGEGIIASEEKVQAIADFPKPTNITDLRSFMGLTNQLSEFSPDIAAAADPLRPLLSPKRSFTWTADHDTAFNSVKKALSQPPVLAHFDPSRPTVLQTDASRLNGLGYALLQDYGQGKFRLVQCGSRFLSDAETRYATIELECLASVWAMNKCRYYLLGLPHFDLVTDHRPLIPILNTYTLDAVENPRLQRLKEKVSAYRFKAVWRKGKDHCIPDALSRAPVSHPTPEDDILNEEANVSLRSVVIRTVEAISEVKTPTDIALEEIRTAARKDSTYINLLQTIMNGFPSNRYDLHNDLLPYWKIREDLYIDDDLILYGTRVVIPSALRCQVLTRLHDSHRGIEATKRRAKQTVFWPGINADITNTVRACESCQVMQPSQQQEPLMCDENPSRPFESVSADFFSIAGKSFLVYVDRLSGWPVVARCGTDTTAVSTIRHFSRIFRDLGVPVRLRTDGGPQFTSHAFKDFLHRWGVQHIMSTPHYPQSNGHAEAGVKTIKHFILKVAPSGNIDTEEFDKGLLEIRNTPNHTGFSPAQILYGHALRSCVPAHASSFAQEWRNKTDEYDRRVAAHNEKVKTLYDSHAHPLQKLKIEDYVRIQDPVSKR